MKQFYLLIIALLSYCVILNSQCEIGELVPFLEQGKYGYMNRFGQMIIKAKYDEAGNFKRYEDKNLAITRTRGKYSIIDLTGESINKKRYDEIKGYNAIKAEFLAYRHGKLVNISLSGQELEGRALRPTCGALWKYKPKEYQIAIEKMDNGDHIAKLVGKKVLRTKIGQSYDSINKVMVYEVLGERSIKRDTVIGKYDSITGWRINSEEMYLQIWKTGKTGILKSGGEIVLPIEYDMIKNISLMDGIAYVYQDDKVGVISETGKLLVLPTFNGIQETNSYHLCDLEGQILRIKDDEGKTYYYDTIQKEIIERSK